MRLNSDRALNHWLKNKRERPALAWTLSILWLLLIGTLAFFWNLGSTGLVDETEPLFAEAARQMTVTGDWITPFFDGETRFDKPPLIYWCQAIAYQILGVNSFSVRLPSALSAMGLISLAFYTLWSFGGGRGAIQGRYWLCAGFGSALIALNLETIIWARTGVSDMLLTGCMAGALLSFFLGYAQPSKPIVQALWYLAFYVLVGLAVLTKGPVGIVLPVLIIGSFLLYLGNGRQVLREMRVLWGSLLVLMIALPWYILVIQANGWTYINSFFGYHNFERFTRVVNHHSAPWYFYFFVVLVSFAPWSIYLPVAIARLKFWQRTNWRSSDRSTHLGLFALFWFVGVFGFFTIAVTKLASYMLPLIPAAAILVALLWSDKLTRTSKNTSLIWSGWLNTMFLLATAGASFFSPYLLGSDPAIPNLRSLVQQSGLPVSGAAVCTITAVAVGVLLWQRQWRGLLSVNLLGFVAFFIFVVTPTYFLVDQTRQLPLRELSMVAAQAQQPGEALIMVGFKKPSVVFYTQRPVNYISSVKNALPEIKKIAATQPQPPSLLILSQPKKLMQLKLNPPQYQDLGRAGAYQLIRVSKSAF